MERSMETAIIGGGQAGLSLSYYLKQRGRDHVILEKAAQAGEAWRNRRWDSFTLVTPNWSVRLPGAEYSGAEPGGFMPREELVRYLERYAEDNHLPVEYNLSATAVEPDDSGYSIHTRQGALHARNVVVATGLFQGSKVPPFARKISSSINQLHASHYRNPQALPDGGVLVVGAGQSGGQIAEELRESGRKVYLSVGFAPTAPRRYRGKDIFEWMKLTGFVNRTPDKLNSPAARFAANPPLTGKNGGYALDMHKFTRDGIQLAGRMHDAQDGRLSFAPDLQETLTRSEQAQANILKMIDEYIAQAGLDAPPETVTVGTDAYHAPVVTELDVRSAGISTIIWAVGFSFDFSLVRLPVTDSFGYPNTQRGVTTYPGLYFLGMPWLRSQASGLLMGVGEDAAYLAEKIAQ